MTFDELTDTVYALLPDTISRPLLIYKMSTDPNDIPWQELSSPDDWDDAISKVRHQNPGRRREPRQSIEVLIGVLDLVCNDVKSTRRC